MKAQSSEEIFKQADTQRKLAITKLYLLLHKNKEEINLSEVEEIIDLLISVPVLEVASAMKQTVG
jgi:hypothetical protein